MNKKHAVGITLFDGLIYKGRGNFDIKYIVEENSLDYLWCKQFMPEDDLVLLKYIKKGNANAPYFVKILKNTNLLSQLRKRGIKKIVNPHKGHKYIQDWEEKNKIEVISTPINWQIRLENKIWFDRFLIKNKIPKPRSKVCKVAEFNEDWGKIVIQKANSRGGEGTYFVPGKSGLSELSKEIISSNNYYLFREFVIGKPYGICVFIVPGLVALSSIRLQCYFKPQAGLKNKVFAGIQWIPYSSLSGKAITNINKTFMKLGDVLYQKRVYGFINFDFIITSNEDVYIIECNPRQSSATFQLTSNHELIYGIDTLDRLINMGKHKTKYEFLPLPETKFEGSILDFELIPSRGASIKYTLKNMTGLYTFMEKIKYKSPDITKQINDKNEFVYYQYIEDGTIVSKPTTTGKVISGFKLYDLNGQLNNKGKRIFTYFKFSSQDK